MRKLFCALILILALALSAGCQHFYDACTEQEEAALEDCHLRLAGRGQDAVAA